MHQAPTCELDLTRYRGCGGPQPKAWLAMPPRAEESESDYEVMASPQQSAQAVATFLGRAGRLAVFAGLGGAALQAALYTGGSLCLQLSMLSTRLLSSTREVLLHGNAASITQDARQARLSAACGTRTGVLQTMGAGP